METRAAVRRAAEQRRAAEEFTQEWLRRQGPGAAVALERIQNAARNGEHGDTIIDPGPVARATAATFACSATASNGTKSTDSTTTNKLPSLPMPIPFHPSRMSGTVVAAVTPTSEEKERKAKHRRIITTRSRAKRFKSGTKVETFDKAIGPVLASGFLEWHEFLRTGGVNRACRRMWLEARDSYGPWKAILKELNIINCTNKCRRCEQVVLLKANRTCCDIEQWNKECAKRKPTFIDCADIIMANGVLTWRQRGGMRRICKSTYRVYRGECTCRVDQVDRTANRPFLKLDPRFQVDYDQWTDYEKCEAMIRYTRFMIKNLHSFYNFRKLTENEHLPYGLAAWDWTDIQAINMQTQCPKRYAFVMNLVSLYMAQNELHRFPPLWYATAFLGTAHNPYEENFADAMSSEITDQCLPPTDENLVKFLRDRCYPTRYQQSVLGPLVNSVCIFSPLFKMVPLDDDKGPVKMPRKLEPLNEQLIDSMSQQMICTVM
mmetsp:Transcript_21599/g.40333  ORF Transcript_21599/g.40333 Transcript_21599/m.40333 type:complete len:490 (+) Transcript_21599:209-1678(+)